MQERFKRGPNLILEQAAPKSGGGGRVSKRFAAILGRVVAFVMELEVQDIL